MTRSTDLAQEFAGTAPSGNGQVDQNETSPTEWAEPASLDAVDVPGFPVEGIFSQQLHDFIAAEAEATQVPIDPVALTMLAAFAIPFAKKLRVQCPVHQEPVNLYIVNIAPPSERKSSVLRSLMAPIHAYERKVNEELAPAIAVYESVKRTLQKKLNKAEANAADPKGDTDRQSAERERDDLARELVTLEKNAVRRLSLLIGSDCTPERLVGLLAEQGGRLGLVDDEGGLFSMMRGRYAKNAEPNVDAYNQAYSGNAIRQHRISRPPVEVDNPALTIALFVQNEILRGLVSNPHLRGVGLLARFWYVLIPSFVGYRNVKPKPVPADLRETYDFLLRRALEMPTNTDEHGEIVPHVIHLTPEATDVWLAFAERVEIGLRDGGELDGLCDWGGKIAGGVARIAGILHGIERLAAGEITAATMQSAVKVGSYLIGHAKAAFLEMGTDPDVELARRIVVWVEKKKLTTFTRREAHDRFRGRDLKVNELDAPLGILTRTGHIREMNRQPGAKGGRPSQAYIANPYIVGGLE